MKKSIINIQEDDLHAYVDNQLSEEKRKAVEDLMQNDRTVAEKIHQWQQQNEAISIYFDKTSFDDIPEQLNIDAFKNNTETKNNIVKPLGSRKYYAIAASLLLMVASGSGGWFAHGMFNSTQQSTPSFVKLAISAYEVFSVEVLHPVEVGVDKKDHLLAWLSKRIDHPIKVPELEKYGFKLLGGRLLSMQESRPAAQFMFENNKGKRVTLLVSKSAIYKDRDLIFQKEKTVNSFYWMDSEVAYSVSGKIDREKLRKLSKDIYQQINKQGGKQIVGL